LRVSLHFEFYIKTCSLSCWICIRSWKGYFTQYLYSSRS